MTALIDIMLVIVGVGAVAVVRTREPLRQSMVYAVYGFMLTVLFLVLQAPDVALSQLAVGAVAVPLMVMLTVAKVRRGDRQDRG